MPNSELSNPLPICSLTTTLKIPVYFEPVHTGVLKLARSLAIWLCWLIHQEGLPAYWGIETPRAALWRFPQLRDQEGLPAYWGIETVLKTGGGHIVLLIRKQYPLTGVLKLLMPRFGDSHSCAIRKDYPLTGVLKLFLKLVVDI